VSGRAAQSADDPHAQGEIPRVRDRLLRSRDGPRPDVGSGGDGGDPRRATHHRRSRHVGKRPGSVGRAVGRPATGVEHPRHRARAGRRREARARQRARRRQEAPPRLDDAVVT
jgi:hypothetical protein